MVVSISVYKKLLIVGALTLVLLYIFSTSKANNNNSESYKNSTIVTGPPNAMQFSVLSYGDLENMFCGGSIKFSPKTRVSDPICPKTGISSISMTGGRTGNQMWEYASVWAMARHTGLEPYVPKCVRAKLEQFFEHLTVPTFDKIAHCPVEMTTFVKSIHDWAYSNQSIILPFYILEPELVLVWGEDIVREFTLRKELRDKAQEVLTGIIKPLPAKNYTFISVHVRRTDYIKYLKRKYGMEPVKPKFFLNAMDYFKQKYKNILFIFLSDDPKWCDKQFGHLEDVIVPGYKNPSTPAVDLAIMAACNHTIYDYGTFGEWGAILAGGDGVANDMIQNRRKGAPYVKHWPLMRD